jgi:hypothetical protein
LTTPPIVHKQILATTPVSSKPMTLPKCSSANTHPIIGAVTLPGEGTALYFLQNALSSPFILIYPC